MKFVNNNMKNIQRKYYTIYQLVNKINGKIYIGKHKTDDLNDGYMGSGKIIQKAVEKYGINNFEKTYLFIFDNEEQMNNKERELVNENFVAREDTYNLVLGGHGGGRVVGYQVSDETRRKLSEGAKRHNKEHPPTNEYRQKLSKVRKQRFIDNPELRNEYSAKTKETWANPNIRQKRIEGQKRWYKENSVPEERLNKLRVPHSPEWSAKISKALKGKNKSDEHRKHLSESRKGKIRIYNEETGKYKFIDPSAPLPQGFTRNKP